MRELFGLKLLTSNNMNTFRLPTLAYEQKMEPERPRKLESRDLPESENFMISHWRCFALA